MFRDSATTTVRFRAGDLSRLRTLQPGNPVMWFPFRREQQQRISFVQRTEPGTVRALVLAKFGRRDCQSYFPPRLTVQLYPR